MKSVSKKNKSNTISGNKQDREKGKSLFEIYDEIVKIRKDICNDSNTIQEVDPKVIERLLELEGEFNKEYLHLTPEDLRKLIKGSEKNKDRDIKPKNEKV